MDGNLSLGAGLAQETAARDSEIRGEVRCGDAFDLAAALDKESVDLVITSPPYWGMRTYDLEYNWKIVDKWKAKGKDITDPPPYEWYRDHGGALGLVTLPEWYIAHLVEIFDKFKAALKLSGSMWINIGDSYFARWSSIRLKGRQGLGNNDRLRRRTSMGGFRQEKNLLLLPARFAIAMQELRWILRNDLIWFKPNVIPRPEKDRLRLSHEHLFHFVKRSTLGRARYYYDMSAVEMSAYDVVTCNVKSGQDGHSATFPEKLIIPRIASSSPPGGLVIDPFCGTGRALTVAMKLGRHAVGFELMPRYAEAALRSVQQAQSQDQLALNGGSTGTEP